MLTHVHTYFYCLLTGSKRANGKWCDIEGCLCVFAAKKTLSSYTLTIIFLLSVLCFGACINNSFDCFYVFPANLSVVFINLSSFRYQKWCVLQEIFIFKRKKLYWGEHLIKNFFRLFQIFHKFQNKLEMIQCSVENTRINKKLLARSLEGAFLLRKDKKMLSNLFVNLKIFIFLTRTSSNGSLLLQKQIFLLVSHW